MFATLINDGMYHAPHVISKLVAVDTERPAAVPLQITTQPVLTPAAAADVDYALSFDNI